MRQPQKQDSQIASPQRRRTLNNNPITVHPHLMVAADQVVTLVGVALQDPVLVIHRKSGLPEVLLRAVVVLVVSVAVVMRVDKRVMNIFNSPQRKRLFQSMKMGWYNINTVSAIFYKKLGIDNTQITLWTSFLYLPWVIKMFWGPIVDIYSTKRQWILYTQFAMFACLGLIAFSLQLPNFFFISLATFTIGAFISATYDIATDGFYLLALSPEQQALFVGIRSLFYRMAVIFGSGILVVLAGQLEVSLNNIPLSWTIAIGFSALILAILFIFHRLILPLPESDNQRQIQARQNIPFWSWFPWSNLDMVLDLQLLVFI